MAKKRSYVDACLSATRTSGIFTQDMEDLSLSQNTGATPHAVPSELQAGAGDQTGDSAGEFIMPMGPNKGRKLSEIDRETLRKAAAWCKARQKFLDVTERIDTYLGALPAETGSSIGNG